MPTGKLADFFPGQPIRCLPYGLQARFVRLQQRILGQLCQNIAQAVIIKGLSHLPQGFPGFCQFSTFCFPQKPQVEPSP